MGRTCSSPHGGGPLLVSSRRQRKAPGVARLARNCKQPASAPGASSALRSSTLQCDGADSDVARWRGCPRASRTARHRRRACRHVLGGVWCTVRGRSPLGHRYGRADRRQLANSCRGASRSGFESNAAARSLAEARPWRGIANRATDRPRDLQGRYRGARRAADDGRPP